jgi:hypothetical protein
MIFLLHGLVDFVSQPVALPRESFESNYAVLSGSHQVEVMRLEDIDSVAHFFTDAKFRQTS